MALVKSKLYNDLLKVFEDTNGDDSKFADGVSKCFKDYIESGSVITVDAGTVSGGVFAGSGTGTSIKAPDSDCADTIYDTTQKMLDMQTGGDNVLAAAIADGLQQMLDGTTVETLVTGVLTPPSPAPPVSPYTGTAKGEGNGKGLVGSTAPLKASLTAWFSGGAMANAQSGGNELFADELSTEVDACIKTFQVLTEGQGNLNGSKGVGTIS